MTKDTIQLSRRSFLKLAGTSGTGLLLAVYLNACTPTPDDITSEIVPDSKPDSDLSPAATSESSFDWVPNLYINVDQNGILTVKAFRSEMGQGIRTAIAMLIADELDVPWDAVRIEQMPADRKYGDQSTGGSQSISRYYDDLRSAGAVARQMLINAAAQTWGVDAAQCQTNEGLVIHPDGEQQLFYGDLVETAAELDAPRGVQVKENSQLHLIGTDVGHWDTPEIITGKAVYGLDVRLPGMLFAVVARCPVFGGKISSYDDSETLNVPGVRQVIVLDKKIAVVAENSWAAIQGRQALQISWDEGKNAGLSTEELFTLAVEKVPKKDGDAIEAFYKIPYEAHATMEPMNCTAYVHDDVCEVWAPTQSPQEVQQQVSQATGIQYKNVRVNVPLIGGGFGRRLQVDYAVEAAEISKALKVPVQVLWTRDDDLQHDFYHAISVQHFSVKRNNPKIPRPKSIGIRSPVPTGAWRSVGNFTDAFGVQCFIDEMAAALDHDPLDLRLELYNGRAEAVIQLAAEKAGWGEPLPDGWGRGLAYHATFGVTHVAQVAEVSVDDHGNVQVHRVICAIDCGKVVNPDNVAAQMEGGIVFGLTAALKAEVTIQYGRTQQSNFHDYPLLQMSEMPVVEVYIVDSNNPPTGVGEMGVPPIAPAVANAVFAATGKRIRHIPIKPKDLA